VHGTFPKHDPDVAVDPTPPAPNTDHETWIRARLGKKAIGEEAPEETVVAQRTPAPVDRARERENAFVAALLVLARLLMPEPAY
jgi:hypothetical protein